MKRLFILIAFFSSRMFAQSGDVKELIDNHPVTSDEPGLNLIASGQYDQANKFFSNEISKDESNRNAYFKRGVANWALSDTLNACRDWSAVLALGDTEMYNLLESKCHSSIFIESDTLPVKQYRKIFSVTDESRNVKTVVEIMPSYPGGQEKLIDYLLNNTPKYNDGKHGTVYVNFLVSPKGKILYPYVTRGLGGKYDKAARQVVRNMPSWIPGKQKGKNMYVKTNVPVRF